MKKIRFLIVFIICFIVHSYKNQNIVNAQSCLEINNLSISFVKNNPQVVLYNIDKYQQENVDYMNNMLVKNIISPKIVDIKRYNKSLTISWKRLEKVDGYFVYKRKENGLWYEVAHVNNLNECCYIDVSHFTYEYEENFFYTVVAYNMYGKEKIYSNFDKKGACYIDTPIITSINENTIKWTMVDNVDGYHIIYRDLNTTTWNIEKIVDYNVGSCEIEEIYKRDRYYSVKAYRKTDNGTIYSDFEKNITLRYRLYSNKKILFEGDEITSGELLRGKVNISYPKRVEQLLGANIVINANKNDTLSDVLKRADFREKYFKSFDIICIAIGTNDYVENTPIGCIVDKDNTTFYGQLVELVEKIKIQNPVAKVVFITPFFRGEYRGEKDINCNYKKNDIGYTLMEYSKAIISIADIYKLNVYDSNKKLFISPNNIRYITQDYVYPNEEAHSKIGGSLVNYFIKNKLLH